LGEQGQNFKAELDQAPTVAEQPTYDVGWMTTGLLLERIESSTSLRQEIVLKSTLRDR
jgi:hypothetical protein